MLTYTGLSKEEDSLSRRNAREFTTPGEKLGVIEEFMPGPGTYTEEGNIRSTTVGYTITDTYNKLVSIYPQKKRPIFPRRGSIVVGEVVSTQDKTASIRILSVDNQTVPGQFTGIIHISTASSEYIRTIQEAFKAGDIIRAKVISNGNMVIHLSTLGRNLGVFQAFCSRCGSELDRRGKIMGCSTCMNREERKIALDYGKEEGGKE